MMILLKDIACRYLESVQVILPRPNMVMDPRPNDPRGCTVRFKCVYSNDGTTVTLTRTDGESESHGPFQWRVYDPAIEAVPNFNSTIYVYKGVDEERAPLDTTELFIDPSVKIIKEDAFFCCTKIKKCHMFDEVHTIKEAAFFGCYDLKLIRLSRGLKRIEPGAFQCCKSLEALFLPPSLEKIDNYAFHSCRQIRILPLPLNIDIAENGARALIYFCDTFFEVTPIQQYQWDDENTEYNHDEVHQSIIDFYRNLPHLHSICLDTNVNAQTILDSIAMHGLAVASIADHDGMNPLHILAMNPHADTGAILACFHVDKCLAFIGDSRGNTPLDYLREYNLDAHTSVVAALCIHYDAQRFKLKIGRKRRHDSL